MVSVLIYVARSTYAVDTSTIAIYLQCLQPIALPIYCGESIRFSDACRRSNSILDSSLLGRDIRYLGRQKIKECVPATVFRYSSGLAAVCGNDLVWTFRDSVRKIPRMVLGQVSSLVNFIYVSMGAAGCLQIANHEDHTVAKVMRRYGHGLPHDHAAHHPYCGHNTWQCRDPSPPRPVRPDRRTAPCNRQVPFENLHILLRARQ